ncbi:YdcH family protein [Marinimicrococcus flavescens]|uniref:YdcH family protein n=1 Tax=Marinimicrococcus flavescens TaxID=3031815 RepID=A0AAP3XQQ4_9PROT|nr:YdcH family protein [Marinimicrococcus flavescens]
MAMQEHVESLRSKHARLDQLITDELHRPMPDQSTLSRLKREKLKLKEAIERRTLNGAANGEAAH